ncbi:MAG: dihydropteroate synthase [Tissierellia bacterium]|nr:dihydropteroate synthase [Tissierellia bacterium]
MKSFKLKDGKEVIFNRTEIMGIINITDNSFYSGSRVAHVDDALKRAEKMVEEGVFILDIGGESTHPGSDRVPVEEEIKKVAPVVEAIKKEFPDILVSVDTFNLGTAKAAYESGMDILNDITSLKSEGMADFIAEKKLPVILMHMKGEPKTMQDAPHYDDVVKEVLDYFQERIDYARSKGIERDRLILDPGIGFGKDYGHNIDLIKNIESLKRFDLPILLAVSRKGFIGKALGGIPAQERLEGTIATSVFAAERDIEMVRVHDVIENLRAIRMVEALK